MISKTFQYFSFRSLKFNELVYPKGQKMTEKLCVVLEGNIIDKVINKVEAKRYEILFEKQLSEGTEGNIKNVKSSYLKETTEILRMIYWLSLIASWQKLTLKNSKKL